MMCSLALRFVALGSLLASGGVDRLAAQGSLTPPGAPAPNLKSLAEIEPRTAVQSLTGDANATYVITQPGSYYLTGSVQAVAGKSGIAIAASGVTLDLSGFALVGGGAGSGIELRGALSQIAIANGQIRGFTSAGVVSSSSINHLALHRLQVAGAGITILPGFDVLVADCSASGATGSAGIGLAADRGTVERCQVNGCNPTGSFTGILAQTIQSSEVNLVTGSGSGPLIGLSGAVITASTVTSLTQTGSGPVTGIAGAVVRGASVSSLQAGSGGAVGIVGSTVESCTVATVGSGTGAATGINGQMVANCRVQIVNLTGSGSGAAIGISGNTVHGCQVGGIGGPASANGITGISATLISHSSATSVGSPVANSSVIGLNASTVLHSHVGNLLGGSSGEATGILGKKVSDCQVAGGSTPLNSASSLRGIEAEHITECRIADLTASGNGLLAGIYAYRLARNCQISGLSGTAIIRYGGTTSLAGRTEGVTVSGSVGIGLSIVDNHTVTGCSVQGATYGIAASGPNNLIDGNNVMGPSARGISCETISSSGTGLVVRNQIRGATVAIFADAVTRVGPIISTSGTLPASANPWANFTD
ncbi:MAG: hypothetical protein JSR82_10885 [Verrucomicrobia bacterium]|nr:hypothetical protein [Verrucomicrobiota bacterium]